MFSLTICFGPAATSWALMYETKEKAEAAFDILSGVPINDFNGKIAKLSDDFGQLARIEISEIHGLMLEDLDLTKKAHILRALHHAHMQAEGQSAAAADPVLRSQAHRGPSILAPGGFPNGGMRSQ